MFNILFFLQYTSVVLILLECAYITKKWSSPLHGWLFFYCVAVLINNAGYLAYMQAGTEDALVLCWQMVYLGKAWVPFALFMFVLVLCKGRTYPRICTALSLLHAMTYFMILKMRRTGLYYRSFTLSEDGLFPHLEFENGIWHYGFDGLVLLYIVIGVTMVVRTMISQTERHRRKQMTFIVLAVMADCTCHILKLFKLARGYDLNMLGFSIASVFLFIAIFVYDFMNAKTLAREFIMENISEGIVVTDEKDGFIIGNSKGEALLHTIDPIPNRAIQTLRTLHAAGRPLVDQGRTFSVREEVLKDRNHVMGRVYMIEDDTEHFRYIEELKEQKLIADKANQAKGEFLSNMSHEIRSPINAVLGLDEMILRESGEQQIKGYAADIQSSGKMLLSVINDILDFSKIESGKMELVPSDYELSCLVSDLVNMIAARAEAKGLAFVINVDGKTPRQLYGDDTRIKQCVLNILTNAVKYTPEGSVTLDIGAERLDDSRCSLYFSVRDTGIGIKEEDIQKLFSPFERIEEGRNKAIEGTGLGMSIVKSLLAAMGTHLEVESVYGEGSRFSFRVQQQVKDWEPVGNWEEAKMRSARNAGAYTESFQAPGAKVLVVDDTPVNLTVMKGLLKQTRIQIDTAEDGVEGLEKSKAGKYDVIFIDHRMPRMDGMEMVAALRADGENVNRQSVCVALTANTVGDVRGQYIGAGFEDYLAKPVDPKRLESMLVQYLPPELVLHEGDEGWLASDGRAAGGQAAAGQDASGQASDGSPAWGESPAQGGPEDSVPGLAMDRMVLDAAAAFFERRFGLDLAAALMNCGNEDVFQDVLKVFHASIGEKAGCIERYAAEGNWQDYTVLVHALKSSARLIGAGKLSEAAAELEALGNRARSEGDEEAAADIRARTPELLAAYRAYGELLAPLVI